MSLCVLLTAFLLGPRGLCCLNSPSFILPPACIPASLPLWRGRGCGGGGKCVCWLFQSTLIVNYYYYWQLWLDVSFAKWKSILPLTSFFFLFLSCFQWWYSWYNRKSCWQYFQGIARRLDDEMKCTKVYRVEQNSFLFWCSWTCKL